MEPRLYWIHSKPTFITNSYFRIQFHALTN
jgi:hypothetical protein